jgi:hypothetical protein
MTNVCRLICALRQIAVGLPSVNKMAISQFTFEKREWILKCYWKTENVTEVRRRWGNEFGGSGGYFEYLWL